MVSLNEAMEIAKLQFKSYLSGKRIPDEVVERLTVGALRDGAEWVIEVRLLPRPPDLDGLKSDLCSPPSLMIATIRVDSKTGKLTLVQAPELPW
jgi:hypothetical protein